MTTASPTSSYLDFNSFDQMRLKAKNDKNGALHDVAGQFESLFLKMAIKSMRDASPGDDLMGSEATNTFTEMYHNQLSLSLAGKGTLGLADVLYRQMGGEPDSSKAGKNSASDALAIDYRAQLKLAKLRSQPAANPIPMNELAPSVGKETEPLAAAAAIDSSSPAAFARSLSALAVTTGKKLGVDPAVLIAQAALETGWGTHVIKNEKGQTSNNLFNIKAGSHWVGPTVAANTVEFVGGEKGVEAAHFRAYATPAESFSDYAKFIQSNARYSGALAHGTSTQKYAQRLQDAGYATDPNYAQKIARIAQQVSVDTGANQLADSGSPALHAQ